MAYVNIKEAVAKGSFFDGKGLNIAEEFTKRNGEPGEQRYTLFFDSPHGIAEGTRLEKVGGILSVRGRIVSPDNGEDWAAVDVVLNQPTYEIVSAPPQSNNSDETPW